MTLTFNNPAADKDLLERILDFLPYPFVLSEFSEGTYRNLYLNKKFYQEIGYELDEIPTIDDWFLRAYPNEIYRQEIISGWSLRAVAARESGDNAVTMKVEIHTKHDGKRWYEVKASLIHNLQVVAFINIHDEVFQQKELANLNENKNQVLSVLTHDLRSPIQSLQGLIKLAFMEDISQPEFIQLIRSLYERNRNILDLLDTTLLWAKTNFNFIQLKMVPVNVQVVARQVVLAYENFLEVKQLRLTVSLPDAQPITDPDIVNIVLRNLLSNAIKFTPMGGAIAISGVADDGNYELIVSDTGVGMPPDVVQKVMAESGISSRGTLNEHGIGIGISLCLQLLKRVQGKLSLESEVGKGTTVRIRLSA